MEGHEQEAQTKFHGKELIDAIQKQVEYYFSKENLRTDHYLVSQMNLDLYVPVKVIAGFKMIRSLSEDLDTILTAMRECKGINLSPDGIMVRPDMRAQKNTLILRDIPSNIDSKEIRSLFGDQFGKLELKSDIGDCWYVNLEDDARTMEALDHLRQQKFRGEVVKARIKTEHTLKTLQANASLSKSLETPKTNMPLPNQSSNLVFPNFPIYNQDWVNMSFPGFQMESFSHNQSNFHHQGRQAQQQQHPHQRQHHKQPHHQQHQPQQQPQAQGNQQHQFDGNRRNTGGYRRRGMSERGGTERTTDRTPAERGSGIERPPAPSEGGGSERGGRGRGGNTRPPLSRDANRKKRNGPPPPPSLGESQFPPLTTQKRDDIKSYSRQEIIDIISQLSNLEKPELPQDCEAVNEKPNYELEVVKPFPKTSKKSPESAEGTSTTSQKTEIEEQDNVTAETNEHKSETE
jgi:la-related protein 4